MVELYLKSCIMLELCIGRVLFGKDVTVQSLREDEKVRFIF